MKRYALLAGATYYPSPGWKGFNSWHDSVESAKEVGVKLAAEYYGWYQVLDTQDFTIVAGEGSGHSGLLGKVGAK